MDKTNQPLNKALEYTAQETVITLAGVAKYFKLYDDPHDRLKEALHPFGKQYHKKFYALKNINLEIKKGEILGIVGRNGSGKSTLLKIISDILLPNAGMVTVKKRVTALLELGSGFNPDFTGRQNIYFLGALNGVSKNKMDEKITDIIDFAEVGTHIDQPIKTYSTGMKARLAFAISTEMTPDILILDEVLSVGDSLFRRKAYARMRNLMNNNNTTVLFVSHDHASVVKICSRAILLIDGNLVEDADPKQVINTYHDYLYTSKQKQKTFIKQQQEKLAFRNSTGKLIREQNKKLIDDIQSKAKSFKGKKNEISNSQITLKACSIIDGGGSEASVLYADQQYTFHAEYFFNEKAINVAFGWVMKDKKGVVITGITLPGKTENINVVEKGTTVNVEFSFAPAIISGDYTIDIAVTSVINEERLYKYLSRDAFKVKVVSEDAFWGIVDIFKTTRILIN